MPPDQFEERMEAALSAPFPKDLWPASFQTLLGRALDNASPFSLSVKAAAFARVAAFADKETEELSLADAAASLNAIDASTPENLQLSLGAAAEVFINVEASAKAWNEIVEPIKKKVFAEMSAQLKLQKNAPKGKAIKLATGSMKTGKGK